MYVKASSDSQHDHIASARAGVTRYAVSKVCLYLWRAGPVARGVRGRSVEPKERKGKVSYVHQVLHGKLYRSCVMISDPRRGQEEEKASARGKKGM